MWYPSIVLTFILSVFLGVAYKRTYHTDMPIFLMYTYPIVILVLVKTTGQILLNIYNSAQRSMSERLWDATSHQLYTLNVFEKYRQYPEACKYFIRENWGIRVKDFNSLLKLLDKKISVLYSYSEYKIMAKEKDLNADYRNQLQSKELKRKT